MIQMRLAARSRLCWFVFSIGGVAGSAWGQLPSSEERLKILTDPASVKEKIEKERTRPPVEFFRSQVAPFDILPFVKPNHWSTLALEARSNYDDYSGLVQTEPIALKDMPHAMLYRREARLPKAQRMRLGMQVLMPQVPREMAIELIRPGGIRADEVWRASLRTLPPHQMLVMVLTRGSNDAYSGWNRMPAFTPTSTPTSAETTDVIYAERQRYYRLVLPLDPEHPPLSPHPLTWTTISHVIWDGMSPEALTVAQQQAMLDWLHWGGQLILVGGATPSFTVLRDSFLDPYLPADPSGEGVLLGERELKGLSAAYPPAERFVDPNEPMPIPATDEEADKRFGRRYRAPVPILPAPNRPLYLAGLRPREGASVIPLDSSSGRPIGIERRVGRGRVLMLTVNPTDAAIASWPGLDTFVRRVVLRRPEERIVRPYRLGPTGLSPPLFGLLSAPELTWFRLMGRDLASDTPPPVRRPREVAPPLGVDFDFATRKFSVYGPRPSRATPEFSTAQVAAWDDAATLPRLSRNELERASGITIPSASFVLKVILAYLIALVPLNWLTCKYLLGRREWAWINVPLLALGFAIGVERAAAYDMGYDTACDEIDVVEVFGDYPRAHVSRFASIYSTGRVRFKVSFPADPTALALPLDNGRSLRGEDVSTSVWQSYPTPALDAFQVQPRSLAMFRAEQMSTLAGSFSLVREGETVRIVNDSELELRDAVLIDLKRPGERTETFVGAIPAGGTVAVVEGRRRGRGAVAEGLDPTPFLGELEKSMEDRPENRGEVRLVGWLPTPHAGLKLEPAVDRHRGFRAVVVHLRNGPPPAPDGPGYQSLEAGQGRGDPGNAGDPGTVPGPVLRRARPPSPRSTPIPRKETVGS